MSWDDRSRRRAAIRSVLAHAEKNPHAGLPFDALPEVPVAFSSRRELVLALQYDWSRALWARIELLSRDTRRAPQAAADLARTAWVDTAHKHPVLRRLLDDHRDDLGLATTREDEYRTPYVA